MFMIRVYVCVIMRNTIRWHNPCSNDALQAKRTAECEFHEDRVSSKRRTNWNVYYSTKYPLNSSKKWYIAFDKRTGDPLKAMTSIKKTSKCATRGLHEDDIPSLRLPTSNSHLFATISPQRKPNNNKPEKSSQDGLLKSLMRRTYSRKSQQRDQKDRSSEVQLRSLELTLLEDDSLLHTLLSESDIYSSSNKKNKIRHETAKKKQSSRRRKKYSRLRSSRSPQPG